MSFIKLHTDVLTQVADHFGVDLDSVEKTNAGEYKRPQLVKAITGAGVTWEMYKAAFPDPEDLPEVRTEESAPVEKSPVREEPTVLLRMQRSNGLFEVRGYKFTKEHPFVPAKQSDAEYIIANFEGFRVALPSEAEDFYS
jgi:hypothetical protein